jgi:formylglycine-generating enzyme required for sulfatase activity
VNAQAEKLKQAKKISTKSLIKAPIKQPVQTLIKAKKGGDVEKKPIFDFIPVSLINNPLPPCQFSPEHGPEMVVISGGAYKIGEVLNVESAKTELIKSRKPLAVNIPPFAISRCEITVAEFNRFSHLTNFQSTIEKRLKEQPQQDCFYSADPQIQISNNLIKSAIQGRSGIITHATWRKPSFDQSNQSPVVCLTRQDIDAFIQWMNSTTGLTYRLPTEAEWEYAAKANTKSLFSFANKLDSEQLCSFANFAMITQGDSGCIVFSEVGKLQPNGFSLYDMHGGVEEWVEDCWIDNFHASIKNGKAYQGILNRGASYSCSEYVTRGGSTFDMPVDLISTARKKRDKQWTSIKTGFRLARSLASTQVTQSVKSPLVNGNNVTKVSFGFNGNLLGAFEKVSNAEWREQGKNGTSFNFKETKKDEQSVYLFDRSRGVTIELAIKSKIVYYSDTKTPRREQYSIMKSTGQLTVK